MRFLFYVAVAAVTLAGCGQQYTKQAHFEVRAVHPVEGQVNWNGEPFPGATVTFHPQGWKVDPGTREPSGDTGADGRFKLTTYQDGDGAPEGPYVVTVLYRKVVFPRDGNAYGPNLLPKEYESPETSGLKVEVVQGANVVPPLDLRGEFQSAPKAKQRKSNRKTSDEKKQETEE
jgi:hypothetical protein